MKKWVILLILLIGKNICSGQQYQAFPTTNARWVEHSEINMPFIPDGRCWDLQYDITGDTTLNSLTYHKLQLSLAEYWHYSGVGCTNILKTYSIHYAGSFREDIPAKKVYFLQADSANEALLYDFNLNLGDTLPKLLINNVTTNINRVSGIDSVLLQGVYHKRFLISGDTSNVIFPACAINYVSLIEGIGSTFGWLTGLYAPCWVSGSAFDDLVCVSINGAAVYPDGASLCAPVGIENLNAEEKSIEIFPNPVENNIFIHFNSNMPDSPVFSLFNFMGQPVLTKKLENKDNLINIQSLPAGVYLYRIDGVNYNSSGEMVKINQR